MRTIHLLLISWVVVIWGLNFIAIKWALNDMSPLLLNALRFLFASIPAVFFIKPQKIPLKQLLLYAVLMFMLQFSLLFTGIQAGIPAGVASLILQTQVFFTLLLAIIFLGEKPTIVQIFGGCVAFSGIALVAVNSPDGLTFLGFILIILAAITWGTGNFITKKMGQINMLSLVVWSSFLSWPPLLLLVILIDGPQVVWQSVQDISWLSLFSLLYISYAATLFGASAWSWLVSRYPLSMIAPFTLSVPVIALLSAGYLLDEPLHDWKIIAALLVIGGLCINIISAAVRNAKIS